MRGIILAGGTGSRLSPLTRSVNKHLLPVGDKPMIYWPLKVLRDNGIEDITIVSSPDGVGQLAKAMGSGDEFGCRFSYRVQDKPGGIAQALACARTGQHDDIALILGDNVFLPSPRLLVPHRVTSPAIAYLSHVDDPRPFGVAKMSGDMIESVVEKPENPPSNLVVTGLYVFTADVFDVAETTKPSARGEVEITDVLNRYCPWLLAERHQGFWGDAGTIESMAVCDRAVR